MTREELERVMKMARLKVDYGVGDITYASALLTLHADLAEATAEVSRLNEECERQLATVERELEQVRASRDAMARVRQESAEMYPHLLRRCEEDTAQAIAAWLDNGGDKRANIIADEIRQGAWRRD